MLGQVGSLGKAIGSLTKALGAPPVVLQAAPQGAQVEGNLSSLGGGELRKAGTSPMLVIKGQGLTLRLQGLGPGALVHPAEGWKEGGCRGGVKKHLTT